MKTLVAALFLSVAFCITKANAQISMGNFSLPDESSKTVAIDDVQFIAQYEMAFVQDTLNPENITEETMILKTGAKTSMFYSYSRFVADSLMKVQMQNSGGRMIHRRNEQGAAEKGQITYKIFKNYPEGKVTTLERIGPARFLCEEKNEIPEWQILSDTATILNYLCYKAICRFKGRDYEVWFTPEIPRSEGPWKLCGLPGLILRAEDSRRWFVFECTGLFYGQPGEKIQYGVDNYEPVSRKDLNKAYERFAADPIGFTTSSSPNIKVVIMDADGNQAKTPKNIPYNPIELSE